MRDINPKHIERELLIYSILIIGLSIFIILCAQNSTIKADEIQHMIQIEMYHNNNFNHLSTLTTFTTYHHVVASVVNLFDITDVYNYRKINLFFSILLILFFKKCINILNQPQQIVKTLQLVFLPLIFPFYYLVYTDIFSLLMVVLAFYYFLLNRYFAALLFTIFATFTRQPNLVWMMFFLAIIFFDGYGSSLKDIPKRLLKVSVWIIAIIGFLGIFIYNGGIALGDKTQHHVSINLSNVFFMVIVLFFLFAPIFISRFSEVKSILYKYKPLLLLLVLFYPLYHYGFKINHEYNHVMVNYFLRNKLLTFIDKYDSVKFISYIVFSYTIIAVSTIELVNKKWNWLFLIAPISVISMPLIEQRYYIVAIILWQLVRKPVNSRVEILNLLWCIAFSIYFYTGIMSHRFFL